MNVTIQYNEQKYRIIPTKGKTHLGVKDQGLGPVSNGVRRSRLKTKCGHLVFSYTSHQTGIPCGICFNEVGYDYTPGLRSPEIQAGDYRFDIEDLRHSFNTEIARDPGTQHFTAKIGIEYLNKCKKLLTDITAGGKEARSKGLDVSNWRKSKGDLNQLIGEIMKTAFDLVD